MQFVDVTNYVAFRKIFGQQEKKEVLISFLNAVITLPNQAIVEDVLIVNPYQLPIIADGKVSILDIKAKDTIGNTFIVEMQVAPSAYFHKRVTYYCSKSYADQIDKGENYQDLFPVYFIGILDFDISQSNHYFSTHKMSDTKTNEVVFSDIEYNVIELEKFKKTIDELEDIIDQWIYFIKNADNLDMIPNNTNDNGLLSAYDQANKGTWTKEELDEYIYAGIQIGTERNKIVYAEQKGLEKGIEQGIKQGIEQGVMNAQKNTIINGYKNGFSLEQLSILCDISIEEVKKILVKAGEL
jgi:predicted transposase/invertase (TIGR01784 family)